MFIFTFKRKIKGGPQRYFHWCPPFFPSATSPPSTALSPAGRDGEGLYMKQFLTLSTLHLYLLYVNANDCTKEEELRCVRIYRTPHAAASAAREGVKK